MTDNSIQAVSTEGMSSEDMIWKVCEEITNLVDPKLMRMRLKHPEELNVEAFAEEIYESYSEDQGLMKLLCALQGGHPASCMKSVYLSGLRDSLRQIVRASIEFPDMGVKARIEAYRNRIEGPKVQVVMSSSMRDLVETA